MNRASMVVVPELSFAAIAERLSAGGWRVDSQSAESILPGEPEWAIFIHEDAGFIHYTFNPVVSLRVLNRRGVDQAAWEQISRCVPSLDVARLRALLASGDKRSILLGLFAAGELEYFGVLDHVAGLCDHPDARVSAAAVRCREGLLTASMAAVRTIGGDAGRIFSVVPLVEWRRQTLRWLARDHAESNLNIDRVLYSALQDEDAEVRMTAVLTAAKLNASHLIDCLRRMRVPESTSDGADERHRLFYREVWRAAVGYLSTGYAKDAFLQALSGTLEIHDDPTLLLHSLLTPLETGAPPETLPTGVERHEGGYRLTDPKTPLRWVPPMRHWLGEDGMRDPLNPVREDQPGAGFFIWAQAIDGVQDYASALDVCRRFSASLPTADQWEMAARGPDGRRYPWGNTFRHNWRRHPSPWGLHGVGNSVEWTRDEHIVCGGEGPTPCAKRAYVRPDDRAAVRPVIEA